MSTSARLVAALVTSLCPLAASSADAAITGRYGQSYLEDLNGVLVLHLKGTPSEMGYAHGYLMASKVKTVYEALGGVFRGEMSTTDQSAAAAAGRPHIQSRYVDEVTAIAAGANAALGESAVNANRLLELHCWDEICRNSAARGMCAHFAAMGSATSYKHVILGRNYDDEECVRRGVQGGAVVIVYEPDQGHVFCTVGWAGFAGVMVGMNSQGLTVSAARIATNAQTPGGEPLAFQMRRVLETCGTVSAAEQLLRGAARTVSGCALVGSGKRNYAVQAFEFTKDRFEVFTANDSHEAHTYFIGDGSVPIDIAVFDPPWRFNFPLGVGDINAVITQPIPDAVVRSNMFAHHTGTPGTSTGPLLELQCDWQMYEINTNEENYGYVGISHLLPPTYPAQSLDVVYLVDKLSADNPSAVMGQKYIDLINFFTADWDKIFYLPQGAFHSRYLMLRDRVAGNLGAITPDKAIEILGGKVGPEPYNVLTDPNTLESVVIDATAMGLWVAAAGPSDSATKPDANLQNYRFVDFAASATYPLTVQTSPVVGGVIVDGKSWGNAPQTRLVAAGNHAVSFGVVQGMATPAVKSVTVGLDGASITGTYTVVPPGKFSLTVKIQGNGKVSPGGGTYTEGTSVTLKATPDAGWRFGTWQGDANGSSATTAVTITKNTVVNAVFEPVDYTVTVQIEGTGKVILDPPGGKYPNGTKVKLTATTDSSPSAKTWAFVEWKGDADSTDNPMALTVDSNKSVTAVFTDRSTAGEPVPAGPCGAAPAAVISLLIAAGFVVRFPGRRAARR